LQSNYNPQQQHRANVCKIYYWVYSTFNWCCLFCLFSGVYNNHTDTINSLLCQYTTANVILLGDYNFLTIQWALFKEPTISLYGKIESDGLANFSFLNLMQFNTIKNRKNYILD